MTPNPKINQDALRAAAEFLCHIARASALAYQTCDDANRHAEAIEKYLAALPQEGAAGVAEPVAWIVEWQFRSDDGAKFGGGGSTLVRTEAEADGGLQSARAHKDFAWGKKVALYTAPPIPDPDAAKDVGKVEYQPREVGGAWVALPTPAPDAARRENWRDDPSADECWNAGCDFAMTHMCKVLGVDPGSIDWDAATETLDGDVLSVIGKILTAAFGNDDWISAIRARRPTPDADAVRRKAASAWRDVIAERERQISVEGWTPEHDDTHDRGELARAASAYAYVAGAGDGNRHYLIGNHKGRAIHWPWDAAWWKPTDRRQDLVKAGALILAEIERLDRAAIRERQS